MIDQKLVDLNIENLTKNLLVSSDRSQGLRLISRAFDSVLMDKILAYLDQGVTDLWKPETTADYVSMVSTPRLKLNWHEETVIEELHMICDALTPTIDILYPHRPRRFLGINIWRDSEGYDIDWHTDNPVIDISMQVYLKGDAQSPGTSFRLDDKDLDVQFYPNSGYMADNSEGCRIVHKIQHPVMGKHPRYSLFAMWTAQPQ